MLRYKVPAVDFQTKFVILLEGAVNYGSAPNCTGECKAQSAEGAI
jgi:hypothetical protein